MRTSQVQAKMTCEIEIALRGDVTPAEPEDGLAGRFVEESAIEDICMMQWLPPSKRGPSGARYTTHSIFQDVDMTNPEILKLLGNIEKIKEADIATALLEVEP